MTNVSSRLGDYIQLDLPYKIQLDYFDFTAQNFSFHRSPHTGVLAGSNDGGVTWTEVKFFDVTVDGSPTSYSASGVTTFSGFNPGFYKSFRLIWLTLGTGSNNNRAACEELRLYGHRENDLVRLPDPTRVLKYPHVALSGPAQRGYVASASSNYNNLDQYAGWNAFNETVDDPDGWVSYPGSYSSGTPSTYSGVTQPDKLTGIDATSSGGDTSRNGSWLKIEVPHKLRLSQMKLFRRRSGERIVGGFIYGLSLIHI